MGGVIPPFGIMENKGKRQGTKEQEKRRERRTREAVRSSEFIEQDARAAREFLDEKLTIEIGEKVAQQHAMKAPEKEQGLRCFHYERIALSLASLRYCFEITNDEAEIERRYQWRRDQLSRLPDEALSFTGNGGVVPKEEGIRKRERYLREDAIERGSLRKEVEAPWRRLINPKVGVFKRAPSYRKDSSKRILKDDRLKMTPLGKKWLDRIATQEALRWGAGSELMGNPVKPIIEILTSGKKGAPRRIKPKILNCELMRMLTTEWLRDKKALVSFLESLLRSYDKLSSEHYAARVMTAQFMSARLLRTESDDERLRMRFDVFSPSPSPTNLLNKIKGEIRRTGRDEGKGGTSPLG
jgi:hypothetical protein